MDKYSWNGITYRSSPDYHRAIATSWLSSNGLNSLKEILEVLKTTSCEALADDAVGELDLIFARNNDGTPKYPEFDYYQLVHTLELIKYNPEPYFPAPIEPPSER